MTTESKTQWAGIDINSPQWTAKRAWETRIALPHQLGCFEHNAEEIVERAAEDGVDLLGEFDETYLGMTIADRIHYGLGAGTRTCHCPGAGAEDE